MDGIDQPLWSATIAAMSRRVLATMVTTTSYGTWLPGDIRGYVDDGAILPHNPRLLSHARSIMSGNPVYFTDAQQIVLTRAICDAAVEFNYVLTDLSVEPWHLHWVIDHRFDPVHVMAGRLKTRMRQLINRGRIWTEGYHHTCLYDQAAVEARRQYIARHDGARIVNGRPIERFAE